MEEEWEPIESPLAKKQKEYAAKWQKAAERLRHFSSLNYLTSSKNPRHKVIKNNLTTQLAQQEELLNIQGSRP